MLKNGAFLVIPTRFAKTLARKTNPPAGGRNPEKQSDD
jgi:hypothetical protein